MTGAKIVRLLEGHKLSLENEKILQGQVDAILSPFGVQREYSFDKANRVDFFIDGIAIEVKVKGSRSEILRQCERYLAFPEVRTLVLVTNRATGLPKVINNKPCYIVNLSKAWL